MNFFARLRARFRRSNEPEHLRFGKLGERAAKKYLQRQGMKFLAANFRSERGEIDLVFRADGSFTSLAPREKKNKWFASWISSLSPKRDGTCLVFVEVKTRSSEEWTRPAAAVDKERRQRLTRAGLDYLGLLKNPPVKVRFDIVEVILEDGAVKEIRHLSNSFPMERPYRYG